MFDRIALWAYNQNPILWESITLSILSLFITVVGVN